MEPPSSIQEEVEACKFFIHKEGHSIQQEDSSTKQEEQLQPGVDTTPLTAQSSQQEDRSFQQEDMAVPASAIWRTGTKKRGPNRGKLTLGGIKRMETAKKKKQKINLNFFKTGIESGFENQNSYLLRFEDYELKRIN